MRKLSRWLPADTRSVELTSAAALLMYAIAAGLGDLAVLHETPEPVVAVILACFGILQLIGASREIELVRTAACFGAGCWWLWSGLSVHSGGYAAIMLGVGCMYAFVLHATHEGVRWTS